MNVKLLFPSLYLGAHDLNGQDAHLTMRRVVVEDLRSEGGTEKKPILYFQETKARAERDGTKEKRLVLNKTNAMQIAKLHGSEVDDWKGKRITLYPTTAQAFGSEVECIRVRDSIPGDND